MKAGLAKRAKILGIQVEVEIMENQVHKTPSVVLPLCDSSCEKILNCSLIIIKNVLCLNNS